ncbi:hypothetical protein PV326_000358 [Microctonus aethiopoides]|nr:hypothetical protein PV326_000358 [Microctonus aethiopoides]
MKMTVLRSAETTEDVEVDLQKKVGKGIGLCITGFNDGKGVYISDMCRLVSASSLHFGDLRGHRYILAG